VVFRISKDQAKLASAWFPVVEALEGRRLLSASTIQTLPFLLDFNSQRGGLIDKDGEGIGFTRVQANKNGNEYQPNLIDLDTAAGVLRVTTTGNATNGGNAGSDNSLVNALETQFDGTTSGWAINARIIGPLSFLNDPFEQAGIYFGPDQDNFVKLVAIRQSDGNFLQFRDEQSTSTGTTTSLPSSTDRINIGNFANINTLDVRLVGDGATGKVIAYYAINGGAYAKVASELTLSGSKKTAFFNSASRAGLIQFHKNNVGPITVTYDSFSITGGQSLAGRPTVTATRPADGETNVSRDAFIAVDVSLPTAGSGVDTDTLTPTSVKLYRTFDGLAIEGVINTSGGGDAIVFVPVAPLAANTQYTFEITDEVKDLSGASFVPYIARFTTGTQGGVVDSSVSFEQLPQQVTAGAKYTSVVVGPDKKLYATTIDGRILRWNVNADGSLSSPQTINTIITKEGVERMAIGLVFDPASTASNLIAYVTHSQYIFEGATDWTGKLTRLTGSNLQTATDLLIHLPRSVRDHMTNQLAFGPDGALYISQGSNSAMGAPDNAWGQRPERLLTGAILRVDLSKISATLSVKTSDGGTYNPFAANAPVTIYASGVRNAYDLLWHSNGRLYTAVNGSAANGAAPASPSNPYSNTRIDQHIHGDYTGPVVPGINPVQQTQNDFLLRIDQFGYYGHPNPLRYEWVLNGGNPTSGVDPAEVPQYPVGTQPDRNYRGFAWDFGKNYSPNGLVEYKGSAFGGALNGKILVVRYSGGDDVVVLDVDANGNIVNAHANYAGLSHFTDPLDITQDPNTGFLYVAEYGGERITLLRPVTGGAKIDVNKQTFYFNDVHSGATGGAGAGPTQKLTIRNTGSSALTLASDAFSITGPNASQFFISGGTGLPRTVAPGESFDINLAFSASSYGIKTAILNIKSNDATTPTLTVNLRGIGTNGTGGSLEPSLQRLLDLYEIPVVVGDNNPDATAFPVPPQTPNDEIVMPRLLKAGTGPVTVELLGVFANNDVPGPKFGYYSPGTPGFKTELFSILQAHTQSVAAVPQGLTSFDPGNAAFSIYSAFPKFAMREVYSEDHLNLWETNAANRRKVRFYPLKNPNGSVVPNAFVFAFEEWNVSFDQNDVVGIIRNVQAAPAGPEIGIENRDGVPFPDRLVFNRIRELDPDFPNEVKERATLRIRNTGSSALSISSIVLNSSDWVIESGGSVSSISPGNFADITLRFVYNRTGYGNEIRNGTLTINSNDADEPVTTVQLAGLWQSHSEDAPGRGGDHRHDPQDLRLQDRRHQHRAEHQHQRRHREGGRGSDLALLEARRLRHARACAHARGLPSAEANHQLADPLVLPGQHDHEHAVQASC
jgi:hypothetical protein